MAKTNDFNDIEFVDDKEREYFARAKMGLQVEEFLHSHVGRLLHGRAKLELEACQSEALECNPSFWFGRRKLMKIRERAAPARLFMAWCAEAITDGRLANSELENNY